MGSFSIINESMQEFARDAEERAQFLPVDVWPEKERTKERRDRRVIASKKSFALFDRTYFPQSMYPDGYATPGRMQRDIVTIAQTPGVHVILGPRDHGKTVTSKKVIAWLILTGRLHLLATYSHSVEPSSSNLLTDIARLIRDNPRIREDFGTEFEEDNKTQIKLRVHGDRRLIVAGAYSEDKSVRGFASEFGRPEFVFADDVETLSSPLGEKHTKFRVKRINEAYLSLTQRGTLIWNANNFDTRCATNTLRKEAERGILAPHWKVHVYPAWERGRPLWPARFPAQSESELREMVRAKDEADWRGNFQQDPIESDGDVFARAHYREYKVIPSDARGVAYCDPNLSVMHAGDQTATGALLYSPRTDQYYVRGPGLKSYSDSNELLSDYLNLQARDVYIMGFDGNVNQQSSWTNHIRNWCLINRRAYPHVEFCKYNVDMQAKSAQAVWAQGRINFPPGFEKSEIGERFMRQIYAFTSKSAGHADDAADWLICAFELLHEHELARPRAPEPSPSITHATFIQDYY